jgi:hypothetical protein
MVTLAKSNTYLHDRKLTHQRIAENVRQSSAFEGVGVHVRRHAVDRPLSIASEKKAAKGR